MLWIKINNLRAFLGFLLNNNYSSLAQQQKINVYFTFFEWVNNQLSTYCAPSNLVPILAHYTFKILVTH